MEVSDEQLHDAAVYYLIRIEWHSFGAERWVRQRYSEVEFTIGRIESNVERARCAIVRGERRGFIANPPA